MDIQSILIFVVIASVIIFGIHWLFNNKVENFDMTPIHRPCNLLPKFDVTAGSCDDCDHRINMEENSDCKTPLMDEFARECPKPQQSIPDFHKDFFNFRDKTNNNSSMQVDAVDKILDMYLSGNLDEARGQSNMKIKDIFDNATNCGPNLYTRECVRLPKFDNTNPDGWYHSFGTPAMHLVRDNWCYPGERIMNGGQVSQNLYPHDPDRSKELNVSVFN